MCLLFDPSSETRMKKGIERLAGIELYNSLMKFGQSVDVMSDKRYFSYTYKHFWDQINNFGISLVSILLSPDMPIPVRR